MPDCASVPLVDLSLQHATVAEEVAKGFDEVIRSGCFVLGPQVERFEDEFARYCGAAHCVGVASGTDALELSLRAHGVAQGDEVILPTNSFVATAEAVARVGAKPVLVDCDPRFFLIDVDQTAAAVTRRTAAIVPVHLYGQIAPLELLTKIATAAGIPVIEDAAQAHGGRRHTYRAPLSGCASFSFYPGKNLGAYGDAGAIVTNDHEIADRCLRLRNHGGTSRYEHAEVGFNSRLDSLQATVLTAKLRRLDAWNGERAELARRYEELLADIPEIVLPATLEGNDHAWHLYVIRVPRRDQVLHGLHRSGIGAGIHYPKPIHLTRAFAELGYGRGAFPVAEACAETVLSLPIYPGLSLANQERVAEAVKKALREA
jgi:dTDP-4-amino-4,6-dideoxygalactose transaminase